MRAGQQSEMHIAHHSEEQTPVPQACGPAQHAFCIFQGLMAHGLRWEVKECAQGRVLESNSQPPKKVDSRGRAGGGCLVVLQAQNHKLGHVQGQNVQSLGSGRLRWDH